MLYLRQLLRSRGSEPDWGIQVALAAAAGPGSLLATSAQPGAHLHPLVQQAQDVLMTLRGELQPRSTGSWRAEATGDPSPLDPLFLSICILNDFASFTNKGETLHRCISMSGEQPGGRQQERHFSPAHPAGYWARESCQRCWQGGNLVEGAKGQQLPPGRQLLHSV